MDMFRRQGEPQRPPLPDVTPTERYSPRRSRSLHAAADAPPSVTATVGVEQQFVGDGVPALTQTERSNRNARRAVSALAALLLLLVVVPAILLITPNALRAGYGVAPQAAIATVISTAIPPVADSPTPTPTVGPGSSGVTNPAPHPTATPHAQPTATPRPLPTATPRPKPTATPLPTATVNPYGAAATVSFTRTAQPISVPQTMTACAGCGISTAGGGTIPAQYVNPNVLYHPAQWPLTYVSNYGAYDAHPTLGFVCYISPQYPLVCSVIPAGRIIQSNDGHSCQLDSNVIPPLQGNVTSTCTMQQHGRQCFDFRGFIIVAPGEGIINSQSNPSPNQCSGSYGGPANLIPTDCLYWHNTGKSTQSEALVYVKSQVESQGMPTLIQEGSPALVGNYYCGDQNAGYHPPGAAVGGSWWSQYQSATDWRFTYDAGNAPTLQQQRIQAGVPAGFVLDAKSVSICDSGSVQGGVDLANHRAPIACPASARALFDWSTSRQQALAQAIAGKTVAEAQSILANTFGITLGSVQITVKNGAARLPQDPAQIQFGIGDPS